MICALLSWYDERPDDLRECVRSLRHAGVERLIALDGAYRLFPGAKAQSPENNVTAITEEAERARIAYNVVQQDAIWLTEMEKRSALFHIAQEWTTEADWYFVIDADEVVVEGSTDPRPVLAESSHNIARGRLVPERGRNLTNDPRSLLNSSPTKVRPLRCFFRALRDIRVEGTHWTYIAGDGTVLWGRRAMRATEIPDFVILHRTRTDDRRERAMTYYRNREAAGIERRPKVL